MHIVISSLLALAGCASAISEPAEPPADAPTIFALSYAPGPAWIEGAPVTEQNLGDHFGYVTRRFEEGTLLANGLLPEEGIGLYLLAVGSEGDVNAFIADDPVVREGVLQRAAVEAWVLLMEDLDVRTPAGDSLFVLDYTPGRAWRPGRPLDEQDIGDHVGYVGELFSADRLLAGGPLGAEAGPYIVSAAGAEGAQRLVDDDPSVRAGLFEVAIRPWQAEQRQSPAR